MANIKKVKRKRNFGKFIAMFFVVSMFAYFSSFTVIRSVNVNLATQENKLAISIEKLENDVANLDVQVKQLDNRERILDIAEKKGLKVNQENIVAVASTSGE